MSDTNTKVLFYPLERLDLVDLRAVQDLAHNAVSEYVGAVATTKSGLVNAWSSVTIDTANHRLNFADFTALGRSYPADGNQSYYPAYLLKFNSLDSANGDCSYDAARAAAQAYFNANGELPPAPTDSGHVLGTHGDYYPYVYCRPVVNSGDTEVRRFWSLADAQETTDTVATRSVTSVEFAVVPPSQAPSAGGDYSWIRIGQLSSWVHQRDAQGNSLGVELQEVRQYHLADRLLQLDDRRTVDQVDSNAGLEDGLDRAVKYLQNRIEALLQGGYDDSASARNYENYDPPRLSLAGLDYDHGRRLGAIEAHRLSGTFIITSTIDGVAGTDIVSRSYGSISQFPPFIVNARRDYSMLLTDYRTSGLTAPIAVADYSNNIIHLAKAAYSLFISVPDSLAGYGLQVTVTPIALRDYSSVMPGLSTAAISSGSYHSNTWHLLAEDSATDSHKITFDHGAIDADGNTIVDAGFRLVGSCVYGGDLPRGEHVNAGVPLVYSLKLDITLINPITYGGF